MDFLKVIKLAYLVFDFCYKCVIMLLTTRGSIFKEWENPLFDLFKRCIEKMEVIL